MKIWKQVDLRQNLQEASYRASFDNSLGKGIPFLCFVPFLILFPTNYIHFLLRFEADFVPFLLDIPRTLCYSLTFEVNSTYVFHYRSELFVGSVKRR